MRAQLCSVLLIALLISSCTSPPKAARKHIFIIGHRGNPAEAPENTLASIEAAFAVGCDFAEVDVRLSRDGIPVIIHSDTVDRTTDGHGLVAELTLAELKALDAGSWKDKRFKGERIPTLAEALQAARGKGRLFLDVPVEGMGPIIAQAFRTLNLPASEATIATWNTPQRLDMAKHMPGATIIPAEGVPESWDSNYFRQLYAEGVRTFDVANWSRKFIADAHSHKMDVWAYTINDVPTMQSLISEGIDGFETDIPRTAVQIVRELEASQ